MASRSGEQQLWSRQAEVPLIRRGPGSREVTPIAKGMLVGIYGQTRVASAAGYIPARAKALPLSAHESVVDFPYGARSHGFASFRRFGDCD